MYPIGMRCRLNLGPDNAEQMKRYDFWYRRPSVQASVFTIIGYNVNPEVIEDCGLYRCTWVNEGKTIIGESMKACELRPEHLTIEYATMLLEDLL